MDVRPDLQVLRGDERCLRPSNMDAKTNQRTVSQNTAHDKVHRGRCFEFIGSV